MELQLSVESTERVEVENVAAKSRWEELPSLLDLEESKLRREPVRLKNEESDALEALKGAAVPDGAALGQLQSVALVGMWRNNESNNDDTVTVTGWCHNDDSGIIIITNIVFGMVRSRHGMCPGLCFV